MARTERLLHLPREFDPGLFHQEEPKRARSFCRNPKVHESCISLAGSQHVESHKEEYSNSVQADITKHSLKRILLTFCEDRRSIFGVTDITILTLYANGDS